MPRRFAILLVLLLILLVGALFLARFVRGRESRRHGPAAIPTPIPTPVVPPTPIPARRVTLFFEGEEDGRLHPEARDLPVMADDIAFLRAVGSAVLEGPRTPGLLRPFPDGWRIRAAYRMKDGLAVLDLDPPAPKKAEGDAAPQPPARWETGSHEEFSAAQAVIVSAARNIPALTRFILLVGGEPVETLAGHLDLGHPLLPDLARIVEESPTPPPGPETPTSPGRTPPAPPSPAAPAAPGPARPTPTRPAPTPGPGSRADSV